MLPILSNGAMSIFLYYSYIECSKRFYFGFVLYGGKTNASKQFRFTHITKLAIIFDAYRFGRGGSGLGVLGDNGG